LPWLRAAQKRRRSEVSASQKWQPDAVGGLDFKLKSTLVRIAGAIDTGIVRIRPKGGVSQ
jgi:hypothetical protein